MLWGTHLVTAVQDTAPATTHNACKGQCGNSTNKRMAERT